MGWLLLAIYLVLLLWQRRDCADHPARPGRRSGALACLLGWQTALFGAPWHAAFRLAVDPAERPLWAIFREELHLTIAFPVLIVGAVAVQRQSHSAGGSIRAKSRRSASVSRSSPSRSASSWRSRCDCRTRHCSPDRLVASAGTRRAVRHRRADWIARHLRSGAAVVRPGDAPWCRPPWFSRCSCHRRVRWRSRPHRQRRRTTPRPSRPRAGTRSGHWSTRWCKVERCNWKRAGMRPVRGLRRGLAWPMD